MRPEVHVGALDSLVERVTPDIDLEATRAIARRGRFALAVPGGSVGVHVFPALALMGLDWERTDVFWVDERAVPPSSAESNFGLADRLWLEPAGAPPSSLHRMEADVDDLSAAAASYSETLRVVLGEPPRFDLVLLGVGPDGHVASLYPGHPALAEKERFAVAIVDSPKPPPRRLTLTLPLLTGAERVIVMALGESKSTVMHAALELPESSLPISLVLRASRRALVLLDEDAASRL